MSTPTTKSNGLSELAALREILNKSFETIEAKAKVSGLPSLNDPVFDPASEAFRLDPEVANACKLMGAAGLQIAAAVAPPFEQLLATVFSPGRSAALRVAQEANLTEVLKEAGPEGLHIDELGARTGIDGAILGRMLRLLANLHIYREVKPNVFANNRVSAALDIGKSPKELAANPAGKYDGTNGLSAFIAHQLDDITKSQAYLWESLSSPDKERPWAFNHAFNTKKNCFEFFEEPSHQDKLTRFGLAMVATNAMGEPPILKAFDWKALPKNSIVVDVGGGVGAMSLPLAAAHPHLKVIIQDRAAVIEDARKHFQEKLPDALSSGQVELHPHDFFTPQPIKAPAVYHMKSIMHDWPDAECIKILKPLRAAAGPDTKLVLIDFMPPYACRITAEDKASHEFVENGEVLEFPEPLLASGGPGGPPAAGLTYDADAVVLAVQGAQERTMYHIRDLLKSAGWGLRAVQRIGGLVTPVVAVPI